MGTSESTRRYQATPKGKAAKRRATERYNRGPGPRLRYDGFRCRVDAIKLELGCTDCGYNAHAEALQFDHIPERGPKLFGIGGAHSRRWEAVVVEIAKCEVVCANCHAVRTKARRG